jgi:hypothetical protein
MTSAAHSLLPSLLILVACADAPIAPDDAGADAPLGAPLLLEDFAGADATAWPTGWVALGGVDEAGVTDGRAWLTPRVTNYSLGRVGHALSPAPASDVEVTFRLAMDQPPLQGVGFYVRQNGGYLRGTTPHGSGYAVFVDALLDPRFSLWRERDGVEEILVEAIVATFEPGRDYRVRFRCTQDGATTRLAARIWPADAAEPSTWTVETTDATPALQGAAGAIAIDAWSVAIVGGSAPPPERIYVDDIAVRAP